jgi:protein disulfide-isomerase A6
MFSRKGPTSALWKSLAIDFQGKIILAQVRDTQEKVTKEFNVQNFPSLVVLSGGSAPGIVYTGNLERNPMYQFLSEYAPTSSPTASPTPSKRQESTGIFPARTELIEVDYTPKKIVEISELWETCFNTHGTCYLLLSSDEAHLKTLAAINHRLNPKKTMRIFSTDLFLGKEKLFEGQTIPPMIALNSGKGWYKKFDGSFTEKEVAEWMDAVKMGEGKKIAIPKGDELLNIFGMGEKSTESFTTESASTPISTVKEETATRIVSDNVDGVKEVFGDEKETVHDEL